MFLPQSFDVSCMQAHTLKHTLRNVCSGAVTVHLSWLHELLLELFQEKLLFLYILIQSLTEMYFSVLTCYENVTKDDK